MLKGDQASVVVSNRPATQPDLYHATVLAALGYLDRLITVVQVSDVLTDITGIETFDDVA